MKRSFALPLIVAFLLLVPFSADAQFRKIKIAVLDFQLQGKGYETADMGGIVAEWFVTALVKTGRFDVIERRLLRTLLEEQKLGMTGIIDESSATKLGKVLGVKSIISGSVMKLQDVLEINARIIDVETGSIIAAETVRSRAAVRLQDLVGQMSQIIIKNFPLEGYIVDKRGDRVSIDLGRFAGVKTDMMFKAYKEGNVLRHPKTGEVLDVEQIVTGKIKIVNVRDKISEAVIVDEHSAGSIARGQMVKSLAGPLTPIRKPTAIDTTPVYQPPPPPRSRFGRSDESPEGLMRMLASNNLKNKADAAKLIARNFPVNEQLLDEVNDELLKGYQKSDSSRSYIEAYAWMCNALGASGKSKYRPTLERVVKDGGSRKLRKYAKKNLRRLK